MIKYNFTETYELDNKEVEKYINSPIYPYFIKTDKNVSFMVEGPEDAQITLELEPETEYEITIHGESAGIMKTNLGGKLSLGVELEGNTAISIAVEKR